MAPPVAVLVRRYMTAGPQTIEPVATLEDAHRLMRLHRIRHLPVVEKGDLVGLVSLGDLHLLETLKGVDPEAVEVAEAMSRCTYAVGPDEPLARVVQTMMDAKMGSAVVVEAGAIIGVFTLIDALRALRDLLGGAPAATRTGAPRATAGRAGRPRRPDEAAERGAQGRLGGPVRRRRGRSRS
jgi:CBS domain-containing protein